jgi:hypothetical protein
MPNDHDPRRFFSGDRPARTGGEPGAPHDDTFRLSDLGFGPHDDADGAGAGAGADPDTGDPAQATVLDPDSWSSDVPLPAAAPRAVPVRAPAPVAAPAPRTAPGPVPAVAFSGGLRRFGPGVPGPETSAGTAQTAAVWHGTVRPGEPVPATHRRSRRRRGWLLPLAVLLAVLVYLLWQHWPGSSVRVEGVAVRDATAAGGVQGCHSTARVVGTLRTNGDAGTVRYRWRRSDGTLSDELKQHVAKGHRSTEVVLLWSFDGRGSLTATATLDVLGPQQRSAATTFAYRCP